MKVKYLLVELLSLDVLVGVVDLVQLDLVLEHGRHGVVGDAHVLEVRLDFGLTSLVRLCK